jgi:hypothetical protein
MLRLAVESGATKIFFPHADAELAYKIQQIIRMARSLEHIELHVNGGLMTSWEKANEPRPLVHPMD